MDEPVDTDETEAPTKPWWRHGLEWAGSLLLIVVAIQVFGALRAPSLPEQAPDFELRDLDGNSVALSDFRGQTVVLNFWATWCGPCKAEIPSFSAFAEANPEIVVLGVAADGPPPKLKRFADDWGMTYPVLVGDQQTLSTYQISSFPTTVIVDEEGQVRRAHVGVMLRPQLAWATWL